MKKIITICGPTGIGKTGLGIRLAQTFNGEIIGADSMQIYKYMDIGTAKPTRDEISQVPHHMIDFLDPGADYDAGKYAEQAAGVIHTLSNRGKLPMVAGGTGLYIRALVFGLFRSRSVCDKTVSELMQVLEEKGCQFLHDRLKSCDPAAARKIHPNDSFRLVRALEVFQTTGQPISQSQKAHDFKTPRFETLTLGLTMDRDRLYDRINRRVDMMVDQGLLREVENLADRGYSLDLKSMQSIGYRHMGMFLKKQVSFSEAVSLLKRDTRRYAKRQFTWFKKESGIIWVEPVDFEKVQELVNEFLT